MAYRESQAISPRFALRTKKCSRKIREHFDLLDDTLSLHGISNLHVTGNVGAGHIVAFHAVLLGSGIQISLVVDHDVMELGIHFFEGPAQTL